MDPVIIGILGILFLFVLLFIGMPICFALAFIGFCGIGFLTSFDIALSALARSYYNTFTTYSFTVIPLFVIMGEFASISGLSAGIFTAADKWLRKLPGGLSIAAIGACSGFSAICGSSVATAAALGRVALPEMKKYGYDEKLATGSIAAGGTLGFLIPPSIGFVVYGILTEQSIGKLLIAGIIPGIMLTVLYAALIIIWAKKYPKHAPAGSVSASWKEKFLALKNIWELIAAFGFVIGGIYFGFFTPTEAGAAGAFFLFAAALCKRKLSFELLSQALSNAAKISAMIFLILAGAYAFTYFMALSMIPAKLALWLTEIALPRYITLIIILCGYLILGCFLDATSMMVLTLPVILPAILKLGFDPVWFGVIAVLMMEAGLITPPLGLNVFVLSGVADTPMETIFRGSIWFLIAIFTVVAIITIFPGIVLFIPELMR